jgi:hypothetical protein
LGQALIGAALNICLDAWWVTELRKKEGSSSVIYEQTSGSTLLFSKAIINKLIFSFLFMERGLRIRRVGFGKKGQFYLIAAIILATIIIGISVVMNYSKKQDSGNLENLKEELQIESENVLDYGAYNELSDSDMKSLLTDFSKNYTTAKGKDKNLYFIFGKEGTDSLKVVASQSLEETAKINVGNGIVDLDITQEGVSFSPLGNQVSLIVNDFTHDFILEEGENFYFLISQEIGGGVYVTKN